MRLLGLILLDKICQWLSRITSPKQLIRTVGSSTRIPIEIIIYSDATPAQQIEALKLLIAKGLDINYVNPEGKLAFKCKLELIR